MLTEVKAYSSLPSAPTLFLTEIGRAETDLIQIRNIDGLDPVVASVGTTPYGASDGEAYVGSDVGKRNIVLTLHPNPDWNTWSHEALRRVLYAYFMPKQEVRLVFYSDDMDEVEIFGVVESFAANQFSKDPEYIASIICPDPYFKTIDPIVLTGNADAGSPITVDYGGNIPGGMYVKVTHTSGPNPGKVTIQVGNPKLTSFKIDPTSGSVVDDHKYLEMSSFPRSKYVQSIYTDDVGAIKQGTIVSLLSNVSIAEGSEWPMFQPGPIRSKLLPMLEFKTGSFNITSDLVGCNAVVHPKQVVPETRSH